MSSSSDEQIVALLRKAGVLTTVSDTTLFQSQRENGNVLEALIASGALSFDTLQAVLLHYEQASALPYEGGALSSAGVTGDLDVSEPGVDEQQLQNFLLDRKHLTPDQLNTALQEQQRTGHPLWRTLINLEMLTTEEMTAILKEQTPLVASNSAGSPVSTVDVRESSRVRGLVTFGESATPVQIVQGLLEGAVRARATDIHIEPQRPRMRVRYRIDGMLVDVMTIPETLEMPIISRIKVLAEMNITERRLPQDGRLSLRIGEQDYNLRVATVPTVHGEKLVIRVLARTSVLTGLKQLGLELGDEERLRSLIGRPQGMILVTGPIGSGKTTTLYASLNEVNILSSNIVTIEEPVEYQLAGINQVEVDNKSGLTFANGLRAILRQDADILMVGEIRDTETATVAVRAALTGQQLFSTLHTIDTPGAITTLGNFDIPPYLVGSALNGVVAQRLVRCICAECKQWYVPSAAMIEQLGLRAEDHEIRFAYGTGCDACYHSGYLGRTGVFEILRVSETIRRLISERANEDAIRAVAMEEGMNTLRQSGIKKILQGITTPQEVMREIYL